MNVESNFVAEMEIDPVLLSILGTPGSYHTLLLQSRYQVLVRCKKGYFKPFISPEIRREPLYRSDVEIDSSAQSVRGSASADPAR